MWDASRSDPGALSERQRRAQDHCAIVGRLDDDAHMPRQHEFFRDAVLQVLAAEFRGLSHWINPAPVA